jgi:hypothetical protein
MPPLPFSPVKFSAERDLLFPGESRDKLNISILQAHDTAYGSKAKVILEQERKIGYRRRIAE